MYLERNGYNFNMFVIKKRLGWEMCGFQCQKLNSCPSYNFGFNFATGILEAIDRIFQTPEV